MLNKYYRLIALFLDNVESDQTSPFGIHSIARVGITHRRKPGDWYGPQAICNVLHELNKVRKPMPGFSMVVCNDGNVFLDRIEKKIVRGDSVFVVIPVRLGLNRVEAEYLECLKQVFAFESSCGVAGGQEHKALYFPGIINPTNSDPQLLYLDPHFVHEAIPTMRATYWVESLARSDRATGDHWILP